MKKTKQTLKDELRTEYKRMDFPGQMVRGKYAKRLREASNVAVLKPEVAAAFPNEAAVNKACNHSLTLLKRPQVQRRDQASLGKRASQLSG